MNDLHSSNLLNKRAWLDKQIAKAQAKLYKQDRFRLPEDDWPLWRRVVPEVIGVVFLVTFMIGLLFFSTWLGRTF